MSAGRIPTDEGYRAHVDELQSEGSRIGAGETRPTSARSCAASRSTSTRLMLQASQLLGAMSRNVAVVYGAIVQESRVRSLKLFHVEGERVLVVVNLAPEHERTMALRLSRPVSAEAVARGGGAREPHGGGSHARRRAAHPG